MVEKINIVITIIFVIEIFIKIVAMGFENYFSWQIFNIFDCLIVIGSAVDVIISQTMYNDKNETSSVTTALRAIRIMRIFKISRKWKRFEILLDTMGKTLRDITSFTFLLFLFIFIFTLLGMELFAYRARFNPNTNEVDL